MQSKEPARIRGKDPRVHLKGKQRLAVGQTTFPRDSGHSFQKGTGGAGGEVQVRTTYGSSAVILSRMRIRSGMWVFSSGAGEKPGSTRRGRQRLPGRSPVPFWPYKGKNTPGLKGQPVHLPGEFLFFFLNSSGDQKCISSLQQDSC